MLGHEYLAWREVEFGRRLLNSLAVLSQIGDLPNALLKDWSIKAEECAESTAKLVIELLRQVRCLFIVFDKYVDVIMYLNRTVEPEACKSSDSFYRQGEE